MRKLAGEALNAANIVTIAAALVVAFGAAQLYEGARAVGVTTDEPIHADRMSTWLNHGWYVQGGSLENGRPQPDNPLATPYVYGPAYSILAHEANVLLGRESGDAISTSADAYEVRHLIVALLAMLCALAVGLAVRVVTGSWRFGLWGTAALLAVPAWMGQGFFNLKDIPAGTGYTLVTVGLMLALGDARNLSDRRPRWIAIGLLLAAGVYIGVGTRLALWAPFVASIAVYACLRLCQGRLAGLVRDRGADVAVFAGSALGLALVVVAYPKSVGAPLDFLTESVSASAEFPAESLTLTWGSLLDASPPLWYLPAWVVASYPLILGALAGGGAVTAAIAQLKAWKPPRGGGFWGRPELGLALALQQATLLPLLAIVGGGAMYDGIRQHLYVIPALAILSGVGAAALWRFGAQSSRRRYARPFVSTTLTIALLLPMTEQTILFPYNYAYVSPIAGLGGVEGRWEGDYWEASNAEALSHVPRGETLACSLNMLPAEGPVDVPIEYAPCYDTTYGPLLSERGTDLAPGLRRRPGTAWVIGRHRTGNRPPEECEQVDNVTRWLRGETITMSYVMRCPRR